MSSLDVPGYIASITGLGRLVDYFPIKHRTFSCWGSLVLAVISLAAAAAILVIGLLETYDRFYKNGPAVIVKTIAAPAGGAVLLAVIGAASAVAAYRSWNLSAAVFESGLAYSDLKGVRAWRWDDIAGVQLDFVRRKISDQIASTRHTYYLTNAKGERIVLDESISRIEQLGEYIREHVNPRLLERYSLAYERGQAVHFGALTLSKEGGIQAGKRSIPWNCVQDAVVEQGYLQVRVMDGEGLRLASANIPNLEVLLCLLEDSQAGN